MAEELGPESRRIFRTGDRNEWRSWLSENFETADEIWLVMPTKDSDDERISYNDAVEEALCFGWIDSTNRTLDGQHKMRRFTPRRKGSSYSRPNIERLIWLDSQGMIHPSIRPSVEGLITEEFEFPDDIIAEIRVNDDAWEHFQEFSDSYKRIRVAYIDAARKRPEEFRRRLDHFISVTAENRKITGYGGVEKYY